MKTFSQTIKIKTEHFVQFIDITKTVEELVKKSQIKNGLICIYSKHTTMAIRINEKEKGIVGDFKEVLKRIAPQENYYRHNDLKIRTENLVCSPGASDCLNGHSHCLHLLLGSSETVILNQNKLVLGTYQRIFAIELDCGKNREVFIQIIGE